jgi:uncharacterized protein YyaL (SSP411 family)
MIAALARASIVFEKPEWLALAERAFDCIVAKLAAPDGRLFHAFRNGVAKAPATASDYANMTWAALRLFSATGSEPYLEHAKHWTRILDDHYWDGESGGYFTSADDTGDVVVRLKGASDDATPNANAIQLSNLVALAALTGHTADDTRARRIADVFAPSVAHSPVSHCGLLAAELDLDRLVQVAVSMTRGAALRGQLLQLSVPGALEFVADTSAGVSPLSPLAGKTAIDGKSTAYVCVGPVCSAPIHEPQSLNETLRQARMETRAAE